MYKAKESDIFSRREIYHEGRLEYLPTGCVAAIVCEFRGRKATKKCVEQARGSVLILYLKATFWKICKAICVQSDPSRNLASLGIIVHENYV